MNKTDIEKEFEQLRADEDLVFKKIDIIIAESKRYTRKLSPIIVLTYISLIIILTSLIAFIYVSDDVDIKVNLDKTIVPNFELTETVTIENNVSEEAVDYLNDILDNNFNK